MRLRTTVFMGLLAALGLALSVGLTGCGGSSTHQRTSATLAAQRPVAPVRPQTRHCFASPKACGYPDRAARFPAASYVGPHGPHGPTRCTALRSSGSVTVRRAGATISGLNVTGRIVVAAPNVTIENVCVTDDGHGAIDSPPAVEFDATGGRIVDSRVGGANRTNGSVQIALGENSNSGYRLRVEHVSVHNCSECIHNDGWTVKDSFVIANGRPCEHYDGTTCVGGIDHVEDVYCNSGRVTLDHDTLLNPARQTAVVFCDTANGSGGACANRVTITDSLLAGGGYMIYPCANAGADGGQYDIEDNAFARCRGHVAYQASSGGRTCGHDDTSSPADGGYWPRGGYFGVVTAIDCASAPGRTWHGNRWDDNGRIVGCRG